MGTQKTEGRQDGHSVSFLEKITPLARQLNCLDIQTTARICVENIPELVGADLASLYTLDAGNNMLRLQAYNHPFAINKIVSLSHTPPSPMLMAVQSRQLIACRQIDTHTRPVIRLSQRAFAGNYKTGNCLVCPLVCHEEVVGVLNLADKDDPRGFSGEDVALVELFSQLAGASIGNIRLFEKIQRQATTDGLTGLANHRTFYDILERELWRTRRYGGNISVIMVDVDNLKTINDTFGHRAGDMAIRVVGDQIKHCIRQSDTAARYGGDEFAIILPNTSLEDTIVAAQRIVEAVANSPVVWEKQPIGLSVSVGVGRCDPNHSPEDITSRSDKALYSAKQAGKNTVRIFQPSAE